MKSSQVTSIKSKHNYVKWVTPNSPTIIHKLENSELRQVWDRWLIPPTGEWDLLYQLRYVLLNFCYLPQVPDDRGSLQNVKSFIFYQWDWLPEILLHFTCLQNYDTIQFILYINIKYLFVLICRNQNFCSETFFTV